MSTHASEQAPFVLTTLNGDQYEASYGDRLLIGRGDRLRRANLVPGTHTIPIGEAHDEWISGVALEIVVNETNIAVYVNQRDPGLLIADEPERNLGSVSDADRRRNTHATAAGGTYLTAGQIVALTLRQQASAESEIFVGEIWFEQVPFGNHRGGTVDVPVTPPRAMWLRCIVAATRIHQATGSPATWAAVNDWLTARECWQQGGHRPGSSTQPKDKQQYSAWEAVRAYKLRPQEYSAGTDLWRSVQRALVRRGLPTPAEVAYVEDHWSDHWLPYGRPKPLKDETV